MATREVLQEGRRVIVDSKGNKTYAPFRLDDDESLRRPTSRTLGSGAAAAGAQAILDARARREAEAESGTGYKRGGKVTAKRSGSKPATKRPMVKSKSRR